MSMEILDLRGSALEADLKAYGWRQHISRAADDDREGIWVYLPDGLVVDNFEDWKSEMKTRHPGFFGGADSWGNLAQLYRWVKEEE